MGCVISIMGRRSWGLSFRVHCGVEITSNYEEFDSASIIQVRRVECIDVHVTM